MAGHLLRLFHTSDTHLGHQQYPRTDAQGLNQREQDIEAAFCAVVELAVQERPDLFIHAGDLFDGVRPGNRALAAAIEGFLRLGEAGVPTVVIAGNHEHPKLRETGSVLRLLGHLRNVHPVYRGERETVELVVRGQPVRVHAVPQCATNDALAAQVAGIQRAPTGLDLLVVHGAATGVAAFSHAEFNEQALEPSWFDDRFDYVALGHFHGVKQVAPRAWYSGAPERVSIAESGEAKGFLDVQVERGIAHATFRPVAGRPYADLPVLDATDLDGAQVVARARQALATAPAGAVARLRITGLASALRGSLDLRAIQEAGRHLLHLDLSRLEWQDTATQAPGGAHFGGLAQEFAAFAARVPLPGLDRARLVQMGHEVLAGHRPDAASLAPAMADVAGRGGGQATATVPSAPPAAAGDLATSPPAAAEAVPLQAARLVPLQVPGTGGDA